MPGFTFAAADRIYVQFIYLHSNEVEKMNKLIVDCQRAEIHQILA